MHKLSEIDKTPKLKVQGNRSFNTALIFVAVILLGILLAVFSQLINTIRKENLVTSSSSSITSAENTSSSSSKTTSANNTSRVSELFMVSISGTEYSEIMKKYIEDINPGGIILMGSNISSKEQVTKLINDIRSNVKNGDRILFATDQEGGTVSRLKWDPSSSVNSVDIGKKNETEQRKVYANHAKTLKDVGININFAPVADLGIPNSFILKRSFGSDSTKVSKSVSFFLDEHNKLVVGATLKHFPGLGKSISDPHKVLPSVNISKADLLAQDILPFLNNFSKTNFVMTSHILYPNLDKDNPTTFSKILVTDILRSELGYDKVVITDDLNMDAVKKDENKYVKALIAGHDMLLTLDNKENILKAITQISKSIDNKELDINKSLERLDLQRELLL
jgi:beta-N-acetylhexosaminidase